MNRFITAIIVITTSAACAFAGPQVGEKAPPIKIAKWVTQAPPALPGAAAAKHVFIVEFWATWCGPCLKSIPHLAELQKKHKKDGLVVIGVSNEEPETIATFIEKKMKMPYFVGADDEMATTTSWTKDIEYIPYAFVVTRDGVIAWQGNPLDTENMDAAVEQVLAGKFDIEAAKAAATSNRKYEDLLSQLRPAEEAGDKEKFFELLDKMIALKPKELLPYMIKSQKLREFAMDDQIPGLSDQIFEAFKDSPGRLGEIVGFELNRDFADRDPRLLFRCAKRIDELAGGRDAESLHNLARVYCELGMIEKAVSTQKQAVAIASADMKAVLLKVLHYYETALQMKSEQEVKVDNK